MTEEDLATYVSVTMWYNASWDLGHRVETTVYAIREYASRVSSCYWPGIEKVLIII